MLGGVIAFRLKVLFDFGFVFTDSDQAIMAHGLMDYGNGNFYEPRFYGQSYNTMLEAFLAVPLFLFGAPVFKALTIITSILALFPFVFLAALTFFQKKSNWGLIILAIPLLLPIEYAMLTSLSRGFVTGVFGASLGLVGIFYPTKKWATFLVGFCALVGYVVSGNSVVLSIPMLLLFASTVDIKNKELIQFLIAGIVSGLVVYFLVALFYWLNPLVNLHGLHLEYSFDHLYYGIQHVDLFFNYVSPIFWRQGFVWLFIFLVFGVYLVLKGNKNIGLILVFMVCMLVLTFGITKVHDGTDSVFLSRARMFIGLPVLMGLFVSFIKEKYFSYFFLIIPLALMIFKWKQLDAVILKKANIHKNHIVRVDKVESVEGLCEGLVQFSKEHSIDLIIVLEHHSYDFVNYGCSVLQDDFPKTIRPSYERRIWRMFESENEVIKKALVFGDLSAMQNTPNLSVKKVNDGRWIIENSGLTTIELLSDLAVPIREYRNE